MKIHFQAPLALEEGDVLTAEARDGLIGQHAPLKVGAIPVGDCEVVWVYTDAQGQPMVLFEGEVNDVGF